MYVLSNLMAIVREYGSLDAHGNLQVKTSYWKDASVQVLPYLLSFFEVSQLGHKLGTLEGKVRSSRLGLLIGPETKPQTAQASTLVWSVFDLTSSFSFRRTDLRRMEKVESRDHVRIRRR